MLILQCIPAVSSVSPAGTAFPLALVLLVTMIKDGYDDYQRRTQDKYLNNKLVAKVSKGGLLEETHWQDVMTGNLLFIRKDEAIPADIVIISSFDDEGLAFVETAELDGETNLKIKVSFNTIY